MPGPFHPRHPRIIPHGGRLLIDWSHPLTKNLVACYLPGVGYGDLTGITGNLKGGATNSIIKSGILDGPVLGAASNVTGIAATGPTATAGLEATHPLRTATQATLFWRGRKSNTFSAGISYVFQVAYDDINGSPWAIFGVAPGSTTTIIANWNRGGTPVSSAGFTAPANNVSWGIEATFVVNGNTVLYSDGVVQSTTAWGSAVAPNSSATTHIIIGGHLDGTASALEAVQTAIACAWDRALTADEVRYLDQNPYCFMVSEPYSVLGAVNASVAIDMLQAQACL